MLIQRLFNQLINILLTRKISYQPLLNKVLTKVSYMPLVIQNQVLVFTTTRKCLEKPGLKILKLLL